MPKNETVPEKIERFTTAWRTLAPHAVIAGKTVEQFVAAVKPSLDSRAAISTLQKQMMAAQDNRNDADKATRAILKQIFNGVMADPDLGPDSELIDAMGFIRQSEKKKSTGKKKKSNPSE